MTKTADFVKAADAVVAADKTLVFGNVGPKWERSRDEYATRLKLPIEIDGEQFGHHLLIDAFPEHNPRKFCIGLLFADHMIDRLDFDPLATHSNGWHSALQNVIKGPHWHSWELNRPTVKTVGRFLELPFADEFKDAREFDATLRWYCTKRRVALGAHGAEFPAPGRLI